jgi:tripartite-type tricarboxylate transporter receptor subunit TctC
MSYPLQTAATGLKASWLLGAALAVCMLSGGCRPAASVYPNRTVVLICPWGYGGGTDRVSRFIAEQLQRELKTPVIVQNRTGASGAAGHSDGAWAVPDGYTLTMGTFELCTMRAMGISNLTYRDFDPLIQVNADPAALLVRSDDTRWKSLGELLAAVKQSPGKIRMSGTAAGGAWDLARAGLLVAAGLPVDAVIWVPSQGANQSLTDLMGGHIDVVCCAAAEAKSQIDDGSLRVLTVMSATRLPEHPDVPTVKEQGVDWEAVGWRGILLPHGVPEPVKAVVKTKLASIAMSEKYAEFAREFGFGVRVRQGEEFRRFLEAEERRWTGVIDAAGYAATEGKPRVVASADPGPWAFPIALTALLVAGTAVVSISAARQHASAAAPTALPASESQSWRTFWRDRGQSDVVLMMISLLVYLATMPWIGFMASTFLFSTGWMMRLGVRWWVALLMTSLMLVVVHLLFVQQFQVILPTGKLF